MDKTGTEASAPCDCLPHTKGAVRHFLYFVDIHQDPYLLYCNKSDCIHVVQHLLMHIECGKD